MESTIPAHAADRRAEIICAVKKKGHSLRSLAIASGLHPKACNTAVFARHLGGEQAIAELLDRPLWELWPDRWQAPESPDATPHRIDNRRRPTPSTSEE